MSIHSAQVVEDVDLEELDHDPYPFFARMRRESPVAYLPVFGGWVLTSWNGCDAVGKAGRDKVSSFNAVDAEFFGADFLPHLADADHQSLRAAMEIVLGPRAVRRYITEIARPVAREYIAKVRPLGTADATTDLLELISVRTVSTLLGMTDVDDSTLQKWFHALNAGVGQYDGTDDEARGVSDAARVEVDGYLTAAIGRLTAHPDDSTLLSHMIHSETPDGRPRTFSHVIQAARLIMMGGFQEPGHAAATTLLGLLQNPSQLAAVQADQSLVPMAVHEGLRWIAPFTATNRLPLVDLSIEGVTIPKGETIFIMMGSANHDETRYDDPAQFNMFRPRLPVASFGYGANFCAGHFVGREIERIAIEEITTGIPSIRLDPENPALVHGMWMRAPQSLPVVWDAA